MHRISPSQTLLHLLVNLRVLAERVRNLNQATHYRVERCDTAGEFRWKVVPDGSTRAIALRRTRREALQTCYRLEGRGSNLYAHP